MTSATVLTIDKLAIVQSFLKGSQTTTAAETIVIMILALVNMFQ
jgi:hypothetical protein